MSTIKAKASATLQRISSDGYNSTDAVAQSSNVSLKIIDGEIDGHRYYRDGDVVIGASVEVAHQLVEAGIAKVITDEEAKKITEKQDKARIAKQAEISYKDLQKKPLTEWTVAELVAEVEKTTAENVAYKAQADKAEADKVAAAAKLAAAKPPVVKAPAVAASVGKN